MTVAAPAGRFYFGSNFKMHKTLAEDRAFIQTLLDLNVARSDLQLFIIPAFTSLGGLQGIPRPNNLWIGAQNMHWASSGAFTGEISAPMLRDVGVDLVMLGHAERRHKFGETDAELNKKAVSAAANQLRVLLCVGETAEQRQHSVTDEVLAMQLKIALSGYPVDRLDQLMVAYEPVWAIGAGSQEALPEDIAPSICQIRHTLETLFGSGNALHIPVLYGGSVNQDNCGSYVQHTAVDGLFVGRAAWQPEGFVEVLQTGYDTWKRRNGDARGNCSQTRRP